MRRPNDLILQIMNLGVTEDVGKLEKIFSKGELSDIVISANIGQLDKLSWNFLTIRLVLIDSQGFPLSSPRRQIGPDDWIPDQYISDW
jgi:hypothetical protein